MLMSCLAFLATVPCQGLSKKERVVKKQIRPIIEAMSVRDKVAQLVFVDVYPGGDSAFQAKADSIIARSRSEASSSWKGTLPGRPRLATVRKVW